jgi:hypothetical protein
LTESMSRLAVIAACCALGAGATPAPAAPTLSSCRAAQLKLTASLQGATQSLLGTAILTNRASRACALPVRPSRVALVIGPQLLPALTIRMSRASEPPGTPTRRLPAHGRVTVGIRWRNWCGAPRGNVRLKVGLTIFNSETRRVSVGVVRTPVCVDHKYSSRVAVSRFIRS